MNNKYYCAYANTITNCRNNRVKHTLNVNFVRLYLRYMKVHW